MKVLRKLENPPTFSVEEWGEGIATGCYNYAINVLANDFYLVGDFIGNRCTEYTTDEELIDTLISELEEKFYYKVEETTRKVKPKENQFKICLLRDFHTGYYTFYRQNVDGTWSCKIPSDIPQIEKEESIFSGSSNGYTNPKIWIFLVTDLEGVIE